MKIKWAALLICTVLSLDFATKQWVHYYLPLMIEGYFVYPYGGIPLFENFYGIELSINHLANRGAAWGTLEEYQIFLVIARIALIGGMVAYLLYFNRHRSWRLPLSLVIAGAIGNVIDYFRYGHVVDMFHFVFWGYDFPVFNIADSAVTLGIISLLFLSTWGEYSISKVKA